MPTILKKKEKEVKEKLEWVPPKLICLDSKNTEGGMTNSETEDSSGVYHS
jgi:hypothetical protein